jgi:RNA polymerase sigma factor (TIGR02999 family)
MKLYTETMSDSSTPTPVTLLLCDETIGADERAARLMPLVYDQLRAVAQIQMNSERGGHTLQATALVHEAYVKLTNGRRMPWRNRAHFYATAAKAMRQILLDHARSRHRVKRGGNERKRVPLNVVDLAVADDPEHVIALDEALTSLEAENPEAGEIVRLRFYAGLSLDDTSEALGIPRRTLDRRWEFIRAWLFQALNGAESGAWRDDPGSDAS